MSSRSLRPRRSPVELVVRVKRGAELVKLTLASLEQARRFLALPANERQRRPVELGPRIAHGVETGTGVALGEHALRGIDVAAVKLYPAEVVELLLLAALVAEIIAERNALEVKLPRAVIITARAGARSAAMEW